MLVVMLVVCELCVRHGQREKKNDHTLLWWLVCEVCGAFLTLRRDARIKYFSDLLLVNISRLIFRRAYFFFFFVFAPSNQTNSSRMISFQSLYLDLSFALCEWRGLWATSNKMTDVRWKELRTHTHTNHHCRIERKKLNYICHCPNRVAFSFKIVEYLRRIFMTNHLFSFAFFFRLTLNAQWSI